LSDLFNSIFSGELLIRTAGRDLSRAARRVVREVFGESPEKLDTATFRDGLGQAREALANLEFRTGAISLLEELSVPREGLKLDRVRLRAVSPGLENIPAAAPVFYAHRDTWYGNPKCQVNVWIPLHDVDPDNSFRFYLDYFQEQVANDSVHFKADQFRGFGRVEPATGWCYPAAQTELDGRVYDVSMKEGEALLFSAGHLHQTLPNRTGRVRFSVDFRFFFQQHLKANLGAPDLDNESSGLLISEYESCGW
jgi:phytanoyl-CoA dioxygenase PhyH